MERMRAFLLVVAMVGIILMTTNGQLYDCMDTYLRECKNTTLTTCCPTVRYLYTYDTTCLCDLFKAANVTNQDAYKVVSGCNASPTSSRRICPDYSAEGTNSPPSSGDRPATKFKPLSAGAIAGIVVGILLLFAIILGVVTGFGFVSNPHPRSPNFTANNPSTVLPSPGGGDMIDSFKGSFKYEVLLEATDGFSNHNLLGKGGFANVYKGRLPDGRDIAVKRLKPGTCQTDSDFHLEIDTISRVHHKNLVTLFGYCVHAEERLLVFEFVPNGTLESHLHGKGGKVMDWPSRMKVAKGSANGLAYLHESCEPKVIHRDVKTANILLDFNFEPKVADFGLAKSCYDENTHVSTRVAGTFGYLAPEYAQTGKLSEKSDVYSFGVVLLEMITGRSPFDKSLQEEGSLVTWASPLMSDALESDSYDNLVDERLQKRYYPTEMARMVACAASCVRHSAKLRPQISEVIQILKGQMPVDLIQNLKPGHSLLYNSSESQGNFKIGNLSSEEFASGNHSSSTNEHVSNPNIIATGYYGQTFGGR